MSGISVTALFDLRFDRCGHTWARLLW